MQRTDKHEAYSLLRDTSEESRDDYPLVVPQHKYGLHRMATCANLFLFLLNLAVGLALLTTHANRSSRSPLIHCKVLMRTSSQPLTQFSTVEHTPPHTRRILESYIG